LRRNYAEKIIIYRSLFGINCVEDVYRYRTGEMRCGTAHIFGWDNVMPEIRAKIIEIPSKK